MKRLLSVILAIAAATVSPICSAVIINVDFDSGGSSTHVGADGVLSTSGTVWNSAASTGSTTGLLDEFGLATAVGVALSTTGMTDGSDSSSHNNLQDTGVTDHGGGTLDIIGLGSGPHDLAVYGGINMSFRITDLSGDIHGPCTYSPTYLLPGLPSRDYCTFSGLTAFDLGGGVQGLRIDFLDGLITGLQVSNNPNTVPEPHSLSLLALGLLVGLAGTRRSSSIA